MGWILALMNREIRGLHEAAYLLALFAFLSQVLALVRDRAFAHFFGAGPVLDAYFAAFKIPDLLFAFLSLFVSSFAIIPLIATRGGIQTKESESLVGSVLLSFGVVSILIAALLFMFLPNAVPYLFPGFTYESHETVITLSRIMLLQPILLGLSSIIGALVQAARKFVLYALAPIFYNFGIIIGALILYPTLGTIGLAWGVVLGATMHVVVQVAPLVLGKAAIHPRLSETLVQDMLSVVKRSLPRALALSSNQLLMLVLISIASLAATGSVAAISFAFNLQSVPLSVIGVSYAAALFPSLALLWSKGEQQTFVSEVWAAVRHTIFWTAPAIALMIVLRAHIVRVILGSGQFSWNDTRLTAAILASFVISLIAQAVVLIFSRGYYAAGKDVVPVVMNVGIAVAAGMSAWFAFIVFGDTVTWAYFVESLFRITNTPGSGAVMIALGYSAAMTIGAVVFGALFAQDFGFEKRVLRTLCHAVAASVIGAAAAYGTLQVFGPLLPTDTFVGILTQGVSAGVVGLLAWALVLYLLRSREFAEVVTVGMRLIGQRGVQ